MKSEYKLKEDLALAKIDEVYHRKQMEYQQEQINIIEEQLTDIKHPPISQTLNRLNRDDNELTAVVKCQNCNTEDVVILKNGAYNGILCSKCMKGGKVYTNTNRKKQNEDNN